jgi:DNA-binding transcriptional MocR family regulator
MQGIALISQLLISPNDSVVVESPGFKGFQSVIEVAGGKILRVERKHGDVDDIQTSVSKTGDPMVRRRS